MADQFVAVDGVWRKVNTELEAVDGVWRSVNTGLVAVDGVWRAGFMPGPKVTLTAAKHSSAPWSRISYSYTATGTWSGLRIELASNTVKTLKSYGAMTQATVSESNVMTADVLIPGWTYILRVVWVDSVGRSNTAAEVQLTLDQPPKITNFTTSGVTYNHFRIDWTQPMDIDGWNSRDDTQGLNWEHAGNLPYIDWGGLAASTTYYSYTRAKCQGVYGPWSNAIAVTTSPKPYTPGTYYIYPNGTSQTYQSGGSQSAGWQGTGRDYWYGGNGASWQSTRGHQRTAFFYNAGDMAGLKDALSKGASITEAKLYIGRASGQGYSGSRAVPYALHQTSYPNAPGNSSGNQYSPAVPENGGDYYDVPAHWVGHVIKGEHTGFLIGDVNSADYYAGYTKSATGRIKVSIA